MASRLVKYAPILIAVAVILIVFKLYGKRLLGSVTTPMAHDTVEGNTVESGFNAANVGGGSVFPVTFEAMPPGEGALAEATLMLGSGPTPALSNLDLGMIMGSAPVARTIFSQAPANPYGGYTGISAKQGIYLPTNQPGGLGQKIYGGPVAGRAFRHGSPAALVNMNGAATPGAYTQVPGRKASAH